MKLEELAHVQGLDRVCTGELVRAMMGRSNEERKDLIKIMEDSLREPPDD